MNDRLRWWSAASGLALAALLTVALAAAIVMHAATAAAVVPWLLYLMVFLMLCALWSAISLRYARTDAATFILIVSAAAGLPLAVLCVLATFGD